jgi:hypothetical protein
LEGAGEKGVVVPYAVEGGVYAVDSGGAVNKNNN